MLDCYRIDGYCVNKPYRAKLNGQVLKNKLLQGEQNGCSS